MAAKQTPTLLGRLVEHQSHFNPLSTADAQWAIQNPKDAAALCVGAIKNRPRGEKRTESDLLAPVIAHPTNPTFRADDTFFGKTCVKFAYRGDNFTQWFSGQVEEGVPDGALTPTTLTRPAHDRDIIVALGGADGAEVSLAEVWRLLTRQPNGEDGTLLTNGYANIFYARDVNGVLRVVDARWGGDGWGVYADADAGAQDVFRWCGGNRVFSRNSA